MLVVYIQVLCGKKFQCIPKRETGFAFDPHMNDVYVEASNNQSFSQVGYESTILKIKYSNPPNLIF